jgi:glucose/arabinose dehydrogenase
MISSGRACVKEPAQLIDGGVYSDMLARIFLRAVPRMKCFRLVLGAVLVLLLSHHLAAEMLPGFRVDAVARGEGFVSSVVVDSKGLVYFTTTDGWIHRATGDGESERVVAMPTHAGGNGGLLGMVLVDDRTAIVHYTTWSREKVLDDVIAKVDLINSTQAVLKAFACDVELRERGVSDEHHGGNPTLGPDGMVFVGIGEYGGRTIAQKPEWNGGKIWRIDPRTGDATQWAVGMRNPYDLAWDPELQRIVIADNGPEQGDEVHVVAEGANCGWPLTFGRGAQFEGSTAPVFTFDRTVAPTGLARLSGANPLLARGYLLGAFVSRAIYYFPTLATQIVNEPTAIVEAFPEFVIDVTEGRDGSIYFATAWGAASTIYKLQPPARGDCNGDSLVDWRDIHPLVQELGDGDSQATIEAQSGSFAGTWGCDANGDGLISDADMAALLDLIGGRRRAVRH